MSQETKRRVVLATRNPGKVREFRRLLEGANWDLVSLADYPQVGEIPEDGETFAANARHKAREVARLTGETALADDSGICVDALGGRPGVHSARYSDPGATDERNNAKLLEELADAPDEKRTAHYVAVVVLAEPDGRTVEAEGRVDGVILRDYRGSGGFGYDPLFFIPEYGRTFGEVDGPLKDAISHRARALRALREKIEETARLTRPL